jgi:tRNA threonylcarbamoyladenosine biosynthesis protein TsaB
MWTRTPGGSLLNTLLIDCATDIAFIAVSNGKQCSKRISYERSAHSITLFGMIDESLHECGISVRDLDIITVGVGPGSFTGLRIAISSARMLAQVLDIPLVGLSSPVIFALSIKAEPGDDIIIAFDAKKGRVFGSRFNVAGDKSIVETLVPGDYFPDTLIHSPEGSGKLWIAGSGSDRYAALFSSTGREIKHCIELLPDESAVIPYAEKLLADNPDHYTDLRMVLPDYARKSDAEVLLEEKRISTDASPSSAT